MGKYVPDSDVKLRDEAGYILLEEYHYKENKRSAIWVLALFFTFGWCLGVHRLYVGKVWKLLIYFGALLALKGIFSSYDSFYGMTKFEGPLAPFLSEHLGFANVLYLIAIALIIIIPICELYSSLSDLGKRNLLIKSKIKDEVRAKEMKH